jgi:hypothetical protein
MQGRVLGYTFADVPLELVVQTVCILLIAYEDLRISEAWPIATLLGHSRRETREAWDNLTSLFSRFCFDWIQIRSCDGARPFGPWPVIAHVERFAPLKNTSRSIWKRLNKE